MNLGYLFKKYRKLNGLTQKTLGEITNLDDVILLKVDIKKSTYWEIDAFKYSID